MKNFFPNLGQKGYLRQMNDSELSYVSPDGFTVFTSAYHRKRGTCCKSNCLHCPFGFTLKKSGLQFRVVTESDTAFIDQLVTKDWKEHLPENIQIILLKDRVAGVMIKNHIVVKEVYLVAEFKNQGLDKDLIESYFFI